MGEKKISDIKKLNQSIEKKELVPFNEILNGINPMWTNLEKALYIYIELEKRLEKVDSKVIAETYKIFMDKLDIPSKIMLGVEGNAWNEIMINGQFYPLDLSWDCEYFHSPESNGKIGVCNFLVNQRFYFNPNHQTKQLSKLDMEKIRALDPELIYSALKALEGDFEKIDITKSPVLEIKSKELHGFFKKNKISADSIENKNEIQINLSDNDTGTLKSDIKQIAQYYPQLLRHVELKNTSSSKVNFQEIVDEIYFAKLSLVRTDEAHYPSSITILSDNSQDFDLDFSKAPAVYRNNNETLNDQDEKQGIILKNTSNSTISLPNLKGKLSKNIASITVDGFDLKDLDLTDSGIVKFIVKSKNTKNLHQVYGLSDIPEIKVNGISSTELDTYIRDIYPYSTKIYDLTITGQDFHDRKILEELAVNPRLARLLISDCKLNLLDGLETFNGRLGLLGLMYNKLNVDDLERVFKFYKNNPSLEWYFNNNSGVFNEILNEEFNISDESYQIIKNQLTQSGDLLHVHSKSEAIDTLLWNMPHIPYYIKDAEIIRNKLKITANPLLLENDNDINVIDFEKDFLQDATLLLTVSQLETLLQSQKRIPQNIRLKISGVSELSSNDVKNLNQRAIRNGLNLTGIQVFDNDIDNTHTQIAPYKLSEYVYLRDTLDLVVDGIDPNETDLDKFTTVYTRLADSIIYDHEATIHTNTNESLYYADAMNSSRNLNNGLIYGKCVCAGYADILRNALELVGIKSRLNSGLVVKGDNNTGHAWNQVQIDDGTGNKKWYYADLTWDRQKDDITGIRRNFDYMLKGSRTFIKSHEQTDTQNIEHVEEEDFDRLELAKSIQRAKNRRCDVTKIRNKIDIPDDPQISIQIDDDRIREEFKRRTNDMFAKYYGNKEYQKEYEIRSNRFKQHEIEQSNNGINYRTIEDYAEKEDDEKFLQLDKYQECLERVSRYESGDSNVYQGNFDKISKDYQSDKEYVETRNHTFNQHELTHKDLATLGKYGERVPYIPRQQGIVKNIGRLIANGSIAVRNAFTPIYRGIGRFVAQPLHRLVTGGKDASPYRNNLYHRMVARRDYFLEEAQKRDYEETQNRIHNAIDPNTVKTVHHPIRNNLEARIKALIQPKIGNEAVLRAGAADIKENIKKQESQKAMIQNLETRIQNYRSQINFLNQALHTKPFASNKGEVLNAINDKITKMNSLEQTLLKYTIDSDIQNDAISSKQHSIASKEVNTLRTTVIKGVVKGLSVKYVGPKIEKWLLDRGKTLKSHQITSQEIQESDVWIPTTYKKQVTPIYDKVLDKGKNMQDIVSANKGKEVKGFFSVYGGEKGEGVYQLTGDEKITAVFQSVGKGGTGLSDTVGLKAPELTSGTFAQTLLDSSGMLNQNITIEQLVAGLNLKNIDIGALDNLYVSIGDNYWTKLSDLVGDLFKEVKVGEVTQKVIDVAGHYEKVQNIVSKTKAVEELVVNPAITAGVNVAKNVMKGSVGMDSIIDVVENVRPTTTNTKSNKKKPRKYNYQDIDISNIPTSRKEYQKHVEEERS